MSEVVQEYNLFDLVEDIIRRIKFYPGRLVHLHLRPSHTCPTILNYLFFYLKTEITKIIQLVDWGKDLPCYSDANTLCIQILEASHPQDSSMCRIVNPTHYIYDFPRLRPCGANDALCNRCVGMIKVLRPRTKKVTPNRLITDWVKQLKIEDLHENSKGSTVPKSKLIDTLRSRVEAEIVCSSISSRLCPNEFSIKDSDHPITLAHPNTIINAYSEWAAEKSCQTELHHTWSTLNYEGVPCNRTENIINSSSQTGDPTCKSPSLNKSLPILSCKESHVHEEFSDSSCSLPIIGKVSQKRSKNSPQKLPHFPSNVRLRSENFFKNIQKSASENSQEEIIPPKKKLSSVVLEGIPRSYYFDHELQCFLPKHLGFEGFSTQDLNILKYN